MRFVSLVGKPQLKARAKVGNQEMELKDIMCGDLAAKFRQFLEVEYPVERFSWFYIKIQIF